jgi:hypothetical protein
MGENLMEKEIWKSYFFGISWNENERVQKEEMQMKQKRRRREDDVGMNRGWGERRVG